MRSLLQENGFEAITEAIKKQLPSYVQLDEHQTMLLVRSIEAAVRVHLASKSLKFATNTSSYNLKG